MKRIASIQDISCFGKCSLTVALPIISAAKMECDIVPTAILSTHTGGFTGFTFRDLTEDIVPIAEHWKKEKIELDAIYTGYLGSKYQIDKVLKFFELCKGKNTLYFVDPAMADDGKLYYGFPDEFPSYMKEVVKKADIVVPNITEASMILGKEFKKPCEYDKSYIKDMLVALTNLGPKIAIISGVCYNDKEQGAVAYNKETKEFTSYFSKNFPYHFHGTGDVFSSVLCAGFVAGKSTLESIKCAVDFTVACIKTTIPDYEKHKYGVEFEKCLNLLDKMF